MGTTWIDVKDRLPDQGIEVLVWSERYGRTFATYLTTNKYGTIWQFHDDPIVTFNAPTHWMPLPEVPNTTLTKEQMRHQDDLPKE